jgi:chemotaxis signal transduction protein
VKKKLEANDKKLSLVIYQVQDILEVTEENLKKFVASNTSLGSSIILHFDRGNGVAHSWFVVDHKGLKALGSI